MQTIVDFKHVDMRIKQIIILHKYSLVGNAYLKGQALNSIEKYNLKNGRLL